MRLAVDTAEAAAVAAAAVAVALAHARCTGLGTAARGARFARYPDRKSSRHITQTKRKHARARTTSIHVTHLPKEPRFIRHSLVTVRRRKRSSLLTDSESLKRGPWRAPSDRRPPPPLPCRAFRCPKLRSRRAFPLLLAARVRVRPPPPSWRCPGDHHRIQCGSALLAVRFDQRAARPIAAVCTGHGRVERPGQGLGPPPALPTA